MRYRYYDLIVPFGCNCMSASELRQRNLRLRSFPLDWVLVGDEDFGILGTLFERRFDNFLCLKRLEIIDLDSGDGHLVVEDKKYHYSFVHDFSKGLCGGDIDRDEFIEIIRKYDRRIVRLYSMIEKSKKVLFVINFKEGYKVDNRAIIAFSRRIRGLYPSKIFDVFSVRFNSEHSGLINIDEGVYVNDVKGMGRIKDSFSWLDNVRLSQVKFAES